MSGYTQFIEGLVGREITTVSGRSNRVLAVDDWVVLVATSRSPAGQPVPVRWVTDALTRLQVTREVEVSVESLGYCSGFVGAVLLQVPGAALVPSSPPRVRLAG